MIYLCLHEVHDDTEAKGNGDSEQDVSEDDQSENSEHSKSAQISFFDHVVRY